MFALCVLLSFLQHAKVQLVRSRRDRLELLSDMFSKAGLWEEALRWFAGLSRLGVLPKQADFVDVITALSSSRQWQLASNFLRDVPDRVFTEAMVADLVDRTDDWRILLELLARLKPTGPSSDAIYTATIATCGRASEWERAISLLGESASEAIYGAAINACDKGGEQLRAMQLMDEMCRKKLAPGEVAFSGVLAACRRSGRWEYGLQLLQAMQDSQIPMNLHMYGAWVLEYHTLMCFWDLVLNRTTMTYKFTLFSPWLSLGLQFPKFVAGY